MKSIHLNTAGGRIEDIGFFTEHSGSTDQLSAFTNEPVRILRYWERSGRRGEGEGSDGASESGGWECTTTVRHRLQEHTLEYRGRVLAVFGVEVLDSNRVRSTERAVVKLYHVTGGRAWDEALGRWLGKGNVAMRGGVRDEREEGGGGEQPKIPSVILR